MKYLIVGLGNIGVEYELTRHNIGFIILDRMADEARVEFTQDRLSYKTEIKFKGRSLILVKPTTYMNLSGLSVRYWLQELKISKEKMLVVTDDISLPFGKIRLRPKGSAGGHNGLKNIEEQIGGQEFSRLRFGIGDTFGKGRQVDYVLSPFNPSEFAELVGYLDQSIDAIKSFSTIGLEQTMNSFN